MPLLEKLTKNTKYAYTWGNCYGNVMVLTGRLDLMVEPCMKIWDIVPLIVMFEEAGMPFVDLNMQKIQLDSNKIADYSSIGTNKFLFKELSNIIFTH